MLGGVWSDAARRMRLKLFLTHLSVFIFIPLNFYSDEVCDLNQTTNCFCLFFIGLKERSVCSVCLSFRFLMFDIF